MDLNQAKQTLMSYQNTDPGSFSIQAKQYFEPVVKPLIEEGGQRFSDYFSALPQELLNRPSNTGMMSPELAIAESLRNVGRLGGLYDQNLGLRDYYGTRAEDLGKVALGNWQAKYQMAQDMYDRLFQEDQAAKAEAARQASMAAQYSQQNSLKDYLAGLTKTQNTPQPTLVGSLQQLQDRIRKGTLTTQQYANITSQLARVSDERKVPWLQDYLTNYIR